MVVSTVVTVSIKSLLCSFIIRKEKNDTTVAAFKTLHIFGECRGKIIFSKVALN